MKNQQSGARSQAAAGLLCLAALVIGGAGPARADSARWNRALGGTYDWNVNTNWAPTNAFPNGIDEVASLTNNISSDTTINLNQEITLGALYIGSAAQPFTIAPNGGSLKFDVSVSNAVIAKKFPSYTGRDDIQAPITLYDDLEIRTGAGQPIISGAIGDDGNRRSVIKIGGGGSFTISGANTYGGDTMVTFRTNSVGQLTSPLRLGASEVVPNGPDKGNLIVDGLLEIGGDFSETVNGLSGSGAVVKNGGSATATLIVGDNDQDAEFGGTISTNGSTAALRIALVKIGSGVQTLSGTNGYNGTTTVNGGTLRINGILSTSVVTIAENGTLDGTGMVNNDVTVRGAITAGSGVGSIGTLTVGNLTLETNSVVAFEFDAELAAADKIMTAGLLTIEPGAQVDLLGTAASGVYDLISCTTEPAFSNLTIRSKTALGSMGFVKFGWDGNYLYATVARESGTILIVR